MPIYDYVCRACGHQFEALVLKNTVPECPECKHKDLDRLLSLPAVRSDGSRARVLAEARRRDAKQGAEREHAQRQYEASHDD